MALVHGVTRKVAVSVAVGGLTFLLSQFVSEGVADNVQLSVLIGGIAMLVQFLGDFENRLDELATTTATRLDALEESQRAGLERVSDATALYNKAEQSPLDTGRVKAMLDRAGDLDRDTSPLVRGLAELEIERLSSFLRDVAEHHAGTAQAITYDGEDREWLVGLTLSTQRSIDAIGISDVESGVPVVDGGLWTGDLGHRYFELQREAIDRGVKIRRLFYVHDRRLYDDEPFRTLCAEQDAAGIDIRVLDVAHVPSRHRNRIIDLVVFDDAVTYEMEPVGQIPGGARWGTRRTLMRFSREAVADRGRIFQDLWDAGRRPDWLEPRRADPPKPRKGARG